MIKKLLNKIIRNKTNLEITIEKYIELYRNYNDSIAFIKSQTSTLYSDDKKENTLFLIYFLLNFSDIIKNSNIINNYHYIEIYEDALDFASEQMKSYEYHNMSHVYDVIENLVILYIFDYIFNTTRYKDWKLDKQNMNVISDIFAAIFHDCFYSRSNSYMNEKISASICEEFLGKYNVAEFSKCFNFSSEVISDMEFQETVMEVSYNSIIETKIYSVSIGNYEPNYGHMVHDADILSNFISKELLLNNTTNIIREFNLVPEYGLTDDVIKENALAFLKNKEQFGLKSYIGIDIFDNTRNNLILELEG